MALTKKQERLIREVLDKLEKVTTGEAPSFAPWSTPDEKTQELYRLYVRSWLVPPLREVLDKEAPA